MRSSRRPSPRAAVERASGRGSRSRSRRATPGSCCRARASRPGNGITLANAPGLVDPGYRGELRVLILNTDPERAFEIKPGDRIAQLVLTPFVEVEPVAAPGLSASARGVDGFGSSGR